MCAQKKRISIHALREEGDRSGLLFLTASRDFNPRPPRGGRRDELHGDNSPEQFQSTPSARRATPVCGKHQQQRQISIHALREEGDDLLKAHMLNTGIFQSTPSARRATRNWCNECNTHQHFNPRPPRGGRPVETVENAHSAYKISIHALREEGDQKPMRGGIRL